MHNITLITHLRVNTKKKIMINTDKKYKNSETKINLLKDRFKAVHLIINQIFIKKMLHKNKHN